MHSNYSQTWRQMNPAELFLADFDKSQGKQEEKEVSFKKVAFEIAASFALFILFVYSLSLVDQKITQRQFDNQVFEFSPSIQIQENNSIYEYFEQGYVGQNSLNDLEKYKLEANRQMDNLKMFENLS